VLYKHQPDPPQQLRYRCRNLRCGGLLKNPTDDRGAAFCCEPCVRAHFAARCIVCEAAIAKTSRRRAVCWRSKCRHALQRRPIAGPGDLHPINLQTFPANAVASRANKPDPVLFTRTVLPLYVVGRGIFKSPWVPAFVLHPARAALATPAIRIGNGLKIPDFLKRTHDAERVPT
jgi:hypothetical protein